MPKAQPMAPVVVVPVADHSVSPEGPMAAEPRQQHWMELAPRGLQQSVDEVGFAAGVSPVEH